MSVEILTPLIGKVLTEVVVDNDNSAMAFHDANGLVCIMEHYQDCCEYVFIEDIIGDLDNLIGAPMAMAEVVTQEDDEYDGLRMWTFYKFATIKGYVTVRWCGSSNGYYSVGVDIDYGVGV